MTNELAVQPQGEMKVRFATWTLRQLAQAREEGRLRFDLAIQRNSVWKKEQKQKLIDSVLHGYPIPPIFSQATEDEMYWMLDGKQRNTAWFEYLDNQFPLPKGIKPVRVRKKDGSGDVEYIEVEGKFFKDLPEVLQERFMNRDIIMMEVSNATDEEIEEMFQRLNNGSALSKMELNRAKSGAEIMTYINQVAAMPFFSKYAFISETSRTRFVDQEMILQTMLLLDGRESGISSREVEDYTQALKKSGIEDETKKIVSGTAAYLFDAFTQFVKMKDGKPDHSILNKMLKKIHVPMLFLTAIEAMKRDTHPVAFGAWARDFLIERYTPGSGAYGSRCVAGSAKKENVQGRLKAMKNDFFSKGEKIAAEEGVVKKVAEFEAAFAAQQEASAAHEDGDKEPQSLNADPSLEGGEGQEADKEKALA
jgi:hypothetical protein